MLKQLLVSVSIAGLMSLGYLVKEEVKITHKTPQELKPGSETEVEIIIEKGDISGTAQLRLDFSEGIKAEPIENQGASFTFDDQQLKLIWFSLPDSSRFSVKYRLIVSPDALENQYISGRFSYIKKTDRERYTIPTQSITIIREEGGEIASPEQGYSVFCYRKLSENEEGDIKVDLTINKGQGQGFGRLTEKFNPQLQPESLDNQSGVFTTEEGLLHINWTALPVKDEFTVTYVLKKGEAALEEVEISGFFETEFIMDNTGGKELEILPSVFIYNQKEPEIVLSDETETSIDIPADKSMENPSKKEDTPQTEEEIIEKITNIKPTEKGVTYKVQLIACRNAIREKSFSRQYGFKDSFQLEQHEGWYKITTGKHENYKEARDQRESIGSSFDFDGPFVTAYNRGERISVQEALMISEQSWVK